MRTYVLSCLHHPSQVRNELGMTVELSYQADPGHWRAPFALDEGNGADHEGRKMIQALSWFQGVDTDEFIVVLPENHKLPDNPRPIVDAQGGTDTLYFRDVGAKTGLSVDMAQGHIAVSWKRFTVKGVEVIGGTDKSDFFKAEEGVFGMIGYEGDDHYVMGIGNRHREGDGEGHHYILDRDETPGNSDWMLLSLFDGDQLVFSKVGGHHLRISVVGSERSVTILRWFDGPEFQIESFGLLISDQADPDRKGKVLLELPAQFDAMVEEAEVAETVRLSALESKLTALQMGGDKALPGDDVSDLAKGILPSLTPSQEVPALEISRQSDAQVEEADGVAPVVLTDLESNVPVETNGPDKLLQDDVVSASVDDVLPNVVPEQEERILETSEQSDGQVEESDVAEEQTQTALKRTAITVPIEGESASDHKAEISEVPPIMHAADQMAEPSIDLTLPAADQGSMLSAPEVAAQREDDSSAPQLDHSQALILRPSHRTEVQDDRLAGRNIFGTAGDDRARGRGGNDIFQTGTGSDWTRCGPGDDWVIVKHTAASEDPDQKHVRGDSGWDTADYLNAFDEPGVGIKVSLKTGEVDWGRGIDDLFSIEHVIGTHFADTFEGDTKSNFFEGHRGDDVYIVDGRGRNDRIRDEDATEGNKDVVRFGPSVKVSKLSKDVVDDDLILIVNGKYRLTLEGAARDDTFKIERFELHDGTEIRLDQIPTFQPIVPLPVDSSPVLMV